MTVRFLLVLVGAVAALSCSTIEKSPSGPGAGEKTGRSFLEPWGEISRQVASMENGGERDTAPPLRPFLAPSAVAARDEYVYIADSGAGCVFRYNSYSMALARLVRPPADFLTDIKVLADHSFVVTDPFNSRVLRFGHDGSLRWVFKNRTYLSHPTSVAVDEKRGMVYAADGAGGYIVAFNTAGQVVNVMADWVSGKEGPIDIASIAMGPDGLYVADRVSRAVHVFNGDGERLYFFGDKDLGEPLALDVDEDGRVYVADGADSSIKVFSGGRLVWSAGKEDGGWVRFQGLSDLAVEDGRLYASDNVSGKVYIFLVMPENL
ncbi:MAG: NHL repeat-containing protein [Candidatus Nitrospinota bacterium M3_3B_026]